MDHTNNIITSIDTLGKGHCQLIAVSKKQSFDKILEAKKAGITHFGESYTQELLEKQDTFKDCTVHFIGHLQTNKCEQTVACVNVIHSIDRIKLAKSIQKACIKHKKYIQGFVQINLTKEEGKGGVFIEELKSLLHYIKENCPNIKLLGLMYIPPKSVNPEPLFKEVQKLNIQHNFKELSMGMSADYEAAIKNGATYVRIGTAIFGQR
jgi:pyridoxal phosphate enzyme (YggS family)